ncbi:MAG: histidine kinase [Hymenobacter sp.]|nr:histidine kinase [Hymenobacter sp.]
MKTLLTPAMPDFTPGYLPDNRSWRAVGKSVLVLTVVAVGISVLLSFLNGWANWPLTFGYTIVYTVGLWLTNGYAVDWLNARMPWTDQPLRRLLLTLLVSLGGSLVVIVGVQAAFQVLYWHQPLHQLLAPGNLDSFAVPLIITLIISLFLHSRSFLLQWREAAIRAERVEKENAVARLDTLRRQVDPHFLFNSLNALTSLVEENDPERAARFIRQLAQVYRYVLDSQEQEVVALAEELRFVEAYVFLQRTRLGEGLAVEISLPPAADLDQLLVPPLAVQLLLENALKHNATSQKNPLRIRITLDTATRQLTVRNALRHRRVPAGESTGLGLRNLTARYAFLTAQALTIEKTETEFIVTLPVLELL